MVNAVLRVVILVVLGAFVLFGVVLALAPFIAMFVHLWKDHRWKGLLLAVLLLPVAFVIFVGWPGW